MTTETQLRDVVDATSDLFGGISEFCFSHDYRTVARYAFLVELQGDPGEFPWYSILGESSSAA
ncbi:hypothetical protein EDC04DRAFT_2645614 [Pisolithus marmoratus]|nr:hypothetical protein EDC04DRAFT_2645614 [Pisolithus marmoratus]